MDHFNIIYKILKGLEAALDYEVTNVDSISAGRKGVSYPRWEQVLIMLQDAGYIQGIVCTKAIENDKMHICEPIQPVITLKGLEYLSENTLMKKAANLMRGIKDTVPGM